VDILEKVHLVVYSQNLVWTVYLKEALDLRGWIPCPQFCCW